MKTSTPRLIAAALFTMTLAACGGSSGGDPNKDTGSSSSSDSSSSSSSSNSSSSEDVETSRGVFTDSPVGGVKYSTPTQVGTTNPQGEFAYIEDEEVIFSIGGVNFPPVLSKGKVTPLDMGGEGASLTTPTVLNVIRLLQTLDEDGDPENGITIAEETAAALADTELDFSATTFEAEATTAVTTHLNRELVSETDAKAHFQSSLKGDLLGSWVYEEDNGNTNMLTFFGEDRYVIAHSHADDGDQTAGSAEYGSYAWDPVSGSFSVSLIRETDGSGGLYNASEASATQDRMLTLAEGILTLTVDGEAVQFTALKSEDGLAGAWYLPEADGEGDSDGGVLLTFDGSSYVLVHTWNTEAYDGAEPLRVTSEWNTYQWGADGSFAVGVPSVETDGPGGLFNKYGNEDEDSPKMVVRANGGLDYQVNREETVAFAPVASFEATLKDLEGDTSTAPVKRAHGRFVSDADANYALNKANVEGGEEGSYGIVLKEETNSLTLHNDGTGSIAFSESDVNNITWQVSSSGVLYFTETDSSGDQWFWVVTPIKSKSHTAALVEITTPEGQEDSADVSYITQVQGVGFEAKDFNSLVYNIFEDAEAAYTSTLGFDPSTGTIEAFDDEANVELTGEYTLEAGGKVLQIDFAGQSPHFVVYQGYDLTLGAYKACWIDEETVTDVTAALSFADVNSAECSDYLTTDAGTAEKIQTIMELTAGDSDAAVSAFSGDDFDGLLYNVYQDAEETYITTLTVDANAGTLVADDGDGSATGMEADYEIVSDGSVISIDWITGPNVGAPSFIVFDGYSASANAYRMLWINDEEVTTVSEALAYEDPESMGYLTPDLGMANGLKSVINER